MSQTISAAFRSRRDAEMAVEHIVQEHGVDRGSVTISPAANENTAGTEAARADVEDGHLKADTEGEPKLAGAIKVSVQVNAANADKVIRSLETYDGYVNE